MLINTETLDISFCLFLDHNKKIQTKLYLWYLYVIYIYMKYVFCNRKYTPNISNTIMGSCFWNLIFIKHLMNI